MDAAISKCLILFKLCRPHERVETENTTIGSKGTVGKRRNTNIPELRIFHGFRLLRLL